MGKIIFSIIASLLPVMINDSLNDLIKAESQITIFLLSGFISIVLLVIVQFLIENLSRRFDGKSKYCGHWVEEMTLYQKNDKGADSPIKRMIGIGIIRYDQKTNEYIFVGNTYDLDGKEHYAWNIDYLHSIRNDSMQYVCSVQIPGERSIGQITFYSKNECEGTIWVMNGNWYKFHGHRIKIEEVYKTGVHPRFWAKLRLFYRGMMMDQCDLSKFAHNYSRNFFPPLDTLEYIDERDCSQR